MNNHLRIFQCPDCRTKSFFEEPGPHQQLFRNSVPLICGVCDRSVGVRMVPTEEEIRDSVDEILPAVDATVAGQVFHFQCNLAPNHIRDGRIIPLHVEFREMRCFFVTPLTEAAVYVAFGQSYRCRIDYRRRCIDGLRLLFLMLHVEPGDTVFVSTLQTRPNCFRFRFRRGPNRMGERRFNLGSYPICWEKYTDGLPFTAPCGHSLHAHCMPELRRCPSCRETIPVPLV